MTYLSGEMGWDTAEEERDHEVEFRKGRRTAGPDEP